MLKEGDLIEFPDPLQGGKLSRGTFLEVAVGESIEVPAPDGGTQRSDAAWVRRDADHTTAKVAYPAIRPRPE